MPCPCNRVLGSASVVAGVLASLGAGQSPVWRQRYPSTAPLRLLSLAYDTANQRTLGFEKEGTGRLRTWSWNGRDWQILAVQAAPLAPFDVFTCFDSNRGVVVVVIETGGVVSETWELAAGTWRLVATASGLPRGGLHYLASRSACTIIGAGQSTAGLEVWEYSSGTWARRTVTRAPSLRFEFATASDTQRARIVLFGGADNTFFHADTWEWDGSSWELRQPFNSPAPRIRAAMSYDARRRRCILYGGVLEFPTWEWDGVNWSANLTPPPTHVTSPRMTFDPVRGRLVLFGDELAGNTTWEYFTPLQATHISFGSGCAGTAGTPTLAAAPGSLPWLGEILSCRLTNLPNSSVAVPFGFVGVSRQLWLGISLPFDLGQLGAPGCQLLTSVEIQQPLTNGAGVAQWQLALPATVSLLGASFYQQALVLDPTANAFGAVFSNGTHATIGDR